jgi:hypothetical protein
MSDYTSRHQMSLIKGLHEKTGGYSSRPYNNMQYRLMERGEDPRGYRPYYRNMQPHRNAAFTPRPCFECASSPCDCGLREAERKWEAALVAADRIMQFAIKQRERELRRIERVEKRGAMREIKAREVNERALERETKAKEKLRQARERLAEAERLQRKKEAHFAAVKERTEARRKKRKKDREAAIRFREQQRQLRQQERKAEREAEMKQVNPVGRLRRGKILIFEFDDLPTTDNDDAKHNQ